MGTYRSYEFTAKVLGALEARQETAKISIGRSQDGAVLVLPLDSWRKAVGDVYGWDTVELAQRVNTGTTAKGGIGDAVLLDIVVNQMDKHGDIGGGVIYVVTYWGDDSALLVPANAYWLDALAQSEEVEA